MKVGNKKTEWEMLVKSHVGREREGWLMIKKVKDQ